ncbi:MAG: BON domain-containing protein [Alphaproteobacteria bacterium]|jgi:osmotically-inducible protein OsmY|nr:BON domain-containing protein [Alphaproteobacteria bacterium]
MNSPLVKTPLALLLAGLIAACTPVGAAVGAGATVGVAASEERGVGGAIDDTKIQLEINKLWLEQDFEMYRKVGLGVTEGRVLLTGEVAKPEHRVEAVRLAWQVLGVREVINEIKLGDASGIKDWKNDVWIATELRSRLLFDKLIRNINYTVDAVNGEVYLLGIAQNAQELQRVVDHARDVPRVKRVVSYVVMKDDPKRREKSAQ